MFSTNFTEAKRNGIQVGVYYVPFVKSIDLMGEKKSAKENARFCINLLCGLKLDLPVYLDWEYTQDEQVNVDTEKRTIFAKCFCDEIKNSGYRPGIYTNPDYIRYKLEWKKLKKNNLFLALHKQSDWELRDCYDRMKLGAVIWQFGAGKLDGVSTDVDKGWMYI